MSSSPCKHEAFDSKVAVTRMEDTGQFLAEITIECLQCHRPFQFLGLTPGLDLRGAAMDLDGLEARLAIVPQGEELSPLDEGLVRGFRLKLPEGDH